MNPVSRLYYHLTAYVPRKLPKNPEQFAKLKKIMLEAYGCNDMPSTAFIIAGQVTSTEAHKLRKSYGHIANCIKRLEINAVAAEFRQIANQQNNERLEAAMKKTAEAYSQEQESEKNDQKTEEQPQENAESQPERTSEFIDVPETPGPIPDLH